MASHRIQAALALVAPTILSSAICKSRHPGRPPLPARLRTGIGRIATALARFHLPEASPLPRPEAGLNGQITHKFPRRGEKGNRAATDGISAEHGIIEAGHGNENLNVESI
jgi:hypothetical protein